MKVFRRLILSSVSILTFISMAAQTQSSDTPDGSCGMTVTTSEEIIICELASQGSIAQESPGSMEASPRIQSTDALKVSFAWGADISASVDMSANDMSSLNLSVNVGMKRGWINFLGVGAQADICMSNSCRFYPMYLLFRTNFTDRPTRVFWELKGGVSLNYLEHNHQQYGAYAFTGVGMKLATGRRFTSHLILGYTLLQRRKVVGPEMTHDFTDLHFATVKLGITF